MLRSTMGCQIEPKQEPGRRTPLRGLERRRPITRCRALQYAPCATRYIAPRSYPASQQAAIRCRVGSLFIIKIAMPLIGRLPSYWETHNGRIVLSALFIFFSSSTAFFAKLLEIYAHQPGGLLFSASVIALFAIATVLFFLLICFGRLTRWILALFVLASSQAGYYMAQYGVVIDVDMLENTMQTNPAEFWGLVTPSLVLRTVFLGVLPAWLMLRGRLRPVGFWRALRARLLLITGALVAAALLVVPLTASYASFIREHKQVRLYASPLYFTYSLVRYANLRWFPHAPQPHRTLAADLKVVDQQRPGQIVVLVVGETARADRFALNGYTRDTNPALRGQRLVSFTQVTSCGTSTAVSVPCMFSALGRSRYDSAEARRSDNVLDLLQRSGVQVLWRDNNSDSKGVADRVRFENFRSPQRNPVCDPECRDVGMLDGLDAYIRDNAGHDILIVLHQMGSHGPEYYKRYPTEFEKFRPVCRTGELQRCTKEEIDNAYDNTILYTDHFLSKVIDFLKPYDRTHGTAMLYVSDHGESLGENKMYLHGAPYAFAPQAQIRVPVVLWVGQNFSYSLETAMRYRDTPFSHDELFCGLLTAFGRATSLCEQQRAFFALRKPAHPG